MAAQVLVPATARADVLVLDEPLSFWGGLDVVTGTIIDVHHPQHGWTITDRIVVMPFARGSSSTANSLAEAIHAGTGPAGIVMLASDEIVALGARVAGELYGEWIPVIIATDEDYRTLRDGQRLTIDSEGRMKIEG